MAFAPDNAGLPPFLTLTNGMTIVLTAVSPTTGAQITGVAVSNAAIAADQESLATDSETVPVSGAFLFG